ncbi:hypothetical protein T459_23995 [Capsicum annuum]|uniref:ATP-dependent DNA helicase n=1 Tax=Capsicum annuum TaxID=4072 RepID=A0A2G2YTX4_CAPAN|nr:ATP-dependent DNA helicase RecQ [Capsicum annuum]PHT73210.1 hypothetical protein T459_23995 [Capsicum annuum]
MMIEMKSTLKKYFGYTEFRPYQKEIIEKILDGKDCLVIMATGSGKSLCYQVPPLITGKTAVVISPLISLMQDQVMALKQRGIKADYLSSAQTDRGVQSNAELGHYDILYMTPEKACALPNSFWSRLLKAGMCLLAVDEAHCISEWGHDFRVEYKQLDKLRNVLFNVPFVGLTATATEKVRSDIMNSLLMKNHHVAIGSFDRKNLFYGVKSFSRSSLFVDQLVEEISKYVDNANSTIVYCTTVRDTEEIFKSLLEAGIKAGIYHGQMANKAREEAHRSFIRDEFYVMVATVAFGMGIDKPNIRYVIHYGCPKSLESYYQESGRCGRDGVPSACWLYYTRSDFAKADFYSAEARSASQRKAIIEAFSAAQHYCMLSTCRRKYLLDYFADEYAHDDCGNCDICTSSMKEKDLSREAFLLMSCIQSCGGRWGLNLPIGILRGSRSKKIVDAQFDKLPFHGLGKELSANWWKGLAYQLISHDYLAETFKDMYKTVSISEMGLQFLRSSSPDHQPPLFLTETPEMDLDEKNKDTPSETSEIDGLTSKEFEGFSQAETQLYKMLIEERIKLARATGTAPYAVCGDQTLKRISLTRPSTKARLANIDGVNQHFIKLYGDNFLRSVKQISEACNLSLDGNPTSQTSVPSKTLTVRSNKKLTPAKFEAWKMWHEDGLTFKEIANFPGRAAAIKEQTVLEYILEAAREGCKMNWTRFCEETGLTRETFLSIQNAISKVGTEKLKPIKTELPEEISYGQIKAYLTMQEAGVSAELFSSTSEQSCNGDECLTEISEIVQNSIIPSDVQRDDGIVEAPLITGINGASSPGKTEGAESHLLTERSRKEAASSEGDLLIPTKRQRVEAAEGEIFRTLDATEESILSWLKNFDDGVTLSDLLEHFNGSNEKSLVNLLCCLEGEFLIYRKSNLYKLM